MAMAALLLATIASTAVAEPRSVVRTIRHVMGESDSRQTVRELALRDAKRQTLEETGVFLEAATTLRERTKEGTGYYTNDSEFATDVQQVTAGVTMSEVLKEEWKTEDNAVVLYLTCRVTVDPRDVNDRIAGIVEARRRLGSTARTQNEVDGLKAEVEDLKKRILPAAQTGTVVAAAVVRPDPLAQARAFYDRGLFAEALQSVTEVINNDMANADARILRGQIHAQTKGRYAMAVRDLETAIKLQPGSVHARIVLADIHLRVGGNKPDAKKLLEDALLLAPGNRDAQRMLLEMERDARR
jgi:tetratricopeptide (TPR) repeat protein